MIFLKYQYIVIPFTEAPKNNSHSHFQLEGNYPSILLYIFSVKNCILIVSLHFYLWEKKKSENQ